MSGSRLFVLRVIVATLAVVLAAAGCSGGPEGAAPGSAGGAGPVTVPHVFGSTTVEAPPQRVVTLGVTDADPVLALGITPVGVTGYSFYPSGLGPWAEARVQGERPVRIASDAQPNLEQVASLAPDLIIGISAGFDETTYAQLSRIAPTIARPAGSTAYTVGRAETTRIVATALGRAAEGDELNWRADAAFATARDAHPEFARSTGTVVLPFQGRYGAYTPGDTRGRFLAELGLVQPPQIAALGPGEGFFVNVPRERADLLDGDVLVMLADQPGQREALLADPVLTRTPVVRENRMILPDLDTRGAMTYNSVLSAPFAVDRLVPPLAAALR